MTGSEEPRAAAANQDALDLEFGRWLFAQDCHFLTGVARLDQLPAFALPEVAFAGRSNVGKSTLLNALTGRGNLARTSHTPGRTQQLNFFELAGRLLLVDLPGYGFAQAPRAEVRRWMRLTHDYLRGRPTLRRLCLLIDARRCVQPADLEVMAMLDEAAVSYQIVLTKADKVSAAEIARCREAVDNLRRAHVALHPTLAITSAHKGEGIEALRASLAALAAGTPHG